MRILPAILDKDYSFLHRNTNIKGYCFQIITPKERTDYHDEENSFDPRGGRYAKSQEERTDCADERIRELLDDAAYRDGDAETRNALAAEVLHVLEKEHCIQALYYDPKNQMYSYQYADGSLGGLTMTDFQDSGPLAMN